MRVVRSLLSVVVGFGLFFGALQLLPLLAQWTNAENTAMSMMLMTIGWVMVASIICGFLTGLIAGSHEFPHVAAVGMLMVGMSFLSMRQEALSKPSWYQIAIAGCGPMAAFFGAGIQMLRRITVNATSVASPDAAERD